MIDLVRSAELDVSAASGLVVTADELCVIADDELFLAVYDRSGSPRRRVSLFAGALPQAHAERKKRKPDLEMLTRLPDGRLLALGSGSTPHRSRGVIVDPAAGWSVQQLDLAPLYAALGRELAELNLEGAAVAGDVLWLAQRGNGPRAENALVALDLPRLLGSSKTTAAVAADALRAVLPIALGELAGVPLGLTDLALHPTRGLMFSAAAEASASTYEDGKTAGSVIGIVRTDGQLCERMPLRAPDAEPPPKIEGLAIHTELGAAPRLWLVADPDDRQRRAPLFYADL